MSRQEAEKSAESPVNTVTLLGRLTAAPEERELPSGDVICTFRVSVPRRGRTPMTARSRQATDWVDCVAGGARARRAVRGWAAGDTVRVEGALRRRFYRTAGSANTRLEVEVVAVRRLERAPAPG